jgi:hypothetical protein
MPIFLPPTAVVPMTVPMPVHVHAMPPRELDIDLIDMPDPHYIHAGHPLALQMPAQVLQRPPTAGFAQQLVLQQPMPVAMAPMHMPIAMVGPGPQPGTMARAPTPGMPLHLPGVGMVQPGTMEHDAAAGIQDIRAAAALAANPLVPAMQPILNRPPTIAPPPIAHLPGMPVPPPIGPGNVQQGGPIQQGMPIPGIQMPGPPAIFPPVGLGMRGPPPLNMPPPMNPMPPMNPHGPPMNQMPLRPNPPGLPGAHADVELQRLAMFD